MRIWMATLVGVMALGLSACSDSSAREAGKKAHELANKTEEAAKKAGRKLEHAGRAAKQGWDEAGKPKK